VEELKDKKGKLYKENQMNPSRINEFLVLGNNFKNIDKNTMLLTLISFIIYLGFLFIFGYFLGKNKNFYAFISHPFFFVSMAVGYWIATKYNKIPIMIEYPNVNNLIRIFMIGMFILLYLFFTYKVKYEAASGKIPKEQIEFFPLDLKLIFIGIFITFIGSIIFNWASIRVYIELGGLFL